MNDPKILTDLLKQLNISLTDEQTSGFMAYFDMLIKANEVMNLTAITEYKDVCLKHFADSLSICRIYDLSDPGKKDIKILDIGTGAGFPGIPLKIAYPDIHITLLDSLTKRITFLNKVIEELDLNSVGSISTVDSRAEDYVKEPGIRESFDLVVSRAVANLAVLSEYALPYVKISGSFVSYKGDEVAAEISDSENALSILGGMIIKIDSFTLPNSDISRNLINIQKTCSTPDKYPRKAGLPTKKPLR